MGARKIANVEYLRGLAALGVVVCHVVGQFYGITRYSEGPARLLGWAGQVGVAVFFVLSGFCIRLPMARARAADPRARLDVAEYVRHRALRILPAYWVAIAASIAAGLLAPSGLLDGDHRPASLALHALGLHTLTPSTLNSINGVFWTIGLEAQFYVAYLLFANRRASFPAAGALVGLALATYAAASFAFPTGNPWRTVGQISLPAMLWQWYIGAALADAYAARWPRIPPGRAWAAGLWGARIAAGGLCLALGMADPVIARIHLTYWVLPVAAALVLASAILRQDPGRELPAARPLAFLGRISYSLYLLHAVALALATFVAGRLGLSPLQGASLAIAAAIGLAWIGYEAVERPFIARKRRTRSAEAPAGVTAKA